MKRIVIVSLALCITACSHNVSKTMQSRQQLHSYVDKIEKNQIIDISQLNRLFKEFLQLDDLEGLWKTTYLSSRYYLFENKEKSKDYGFTSLRYAKLTDSPHNIFLSKLQLYYVTGESDYLSNLNEYAKNQFHKNWLAYLNGDTQGIDFKEGSLSRPEKSYSLYWSGVLKKDVGLIEKAYLGFYQENLSVAMVDSHFALAKIYFSISNVSNALKHARRGYEIASAINHQSVAVKIQQWATNNELFW